MKPKVIIDQGVYQKIMHWVNKSNYEVSGLGKVVIENGTLRVVDAMLLPQKNGSTHTDIEGDAVGKAMYELRETEGHLNFWWHSHVNMSVFWSGTDMDTIRKIGSGGWFLNTVFNKKYEMKSSLYVNNAFTQPELFTEQAVFMDDLDTRVVNLVDPALLAQWDTEYETNVENVQVFHKGSTTSTNGRVIWASRAEKKKWKKKQKASKSDTCESCRYMFDFCRCDDKEEQPLLLGPPGTETDQEVVDIYSELTMEDAVDAFDAGVINFSEYSKVRARIWARTNSDDGPEEGSAINRHPPAKKSGPNKCPTGVY